MIERYRLAKAAEAYRRVDGRRDPVVRRADMGA